MNWANRLTLGRLALTVLFVAALNSSWQYGRTAALLIFLIAGVTDFIDGEIARRYGIITNFGKLMDPLVDKIMMAAAFISLVPLKEALRDLDLVAWLKVDVLRRIAAKLADVVNCYLAPTQKPDPLLVREIVESTGCVDSSEQRHVFRERNARRSAHGAPHVYKAEVR